MRKKKQLLIAALLFALMAALYLILPSISKGDEEIPEEKSALPPVETYTLTNIAEDEYLSISIKNKLGQYTLALTDGLLVLESTDSSEQSSEIKLNQKAVNSLSFGLRNLASYEIIEESTSKLADYGLENPSGILTITLADKETVQIKLGNAAASGNGYYCLKEGDDTVYLLPPYMAGTMLNSIDLLRDRSLPSINFQDLKRLTISGEQTIDIVPYFPFEVFSSSLSPLLMIKPYKRPTAVNTQSYSENLETLAQNYRIIDFIDEESIESGLENPSSTVEMTDGDGLKLNIQFGNRTADGSAVYSRISGIDGIVTLPREAAAITEVPPLEMSDRFVRLISIDHVSELRIEFQNELWVAGINWIDEETGEFTFQGEAVEEDPFKKMYQEVLYLLFEGEVPEPFVPEEKAEMTISYIGDDQTPGKTTAEFFNYNQDYYAVSIDGYEAEFLIGKYQVEAMLSYIRTYADS